MSPRNRSVSGATAPPAPGVDDIEPRILVAYGLILLLLVALIATVRYVRHNSYASKDARRREREASRRDKTDGNA